MGKILQLTDKISNVIAAGEVVENPFNVIKELVENSIDAGAKEISILIEESGMRLIRVVDDGFGMSKDDALLCFSRHATSKIKSEQDLFRVTTLGFRGEAIPTIASVSEMEIITSEGCEGYSVIYDAGELVKHNYASSRKGTEVIVKNLFYNVPARLKYIKNLNTELGKIVDYIENMSLSYPNIKFIFKNNNKSIFSTTGRNNIFETISNVYGIEVAKSITEVKAYGNAFDVEIYYGSPINTKSKKSTIKVILNGRYIKDFKITNKIIKAYGHLIPEKRYPIVLVNINIDPILVDVNVHPSKIEVRISNHDEVLEVIYDAISKNLEKQTHIPKIIVDDIVVQESINFENYQVNEFLDIKEKDDIKSVEYTNIENNINKNEGFNFVENVDIKNNYKIPYLFYIGTYNKSFILAQDSESLYLIDQHASQERVMYEYYIEKLCNTNSDSYELLIPYEISIKKSDSFLFNDFMNDFLNIGIELEISNHIIKVKSVPIWFIKGYEKDTTESIINYFIENNNIDIMNFRDELAESMACKASIRANEDLNKDEIFNLLDNLRKCKEPFTCPHGRPTLIKLENNDIEKMFKRV